MNGKQPEFEGKDLAVENILNLMASNTYNIANDHGFMDAEANCPRHLLFGAAHMALIMSEAVEALEVFRKGDLDEASDKVPGLTKLEDEFADIIIRTVMIAKRYGVNIGKGVVLKSKYNESRPFKHGGKNF